jgi:hypothetical protein
MSISERTSLNLNGENRVVVSIKGLGTLEVVQITSDPNRIDKLYREAQSHNEKIQSSINNEDKHVYLTIKGLKDESGKVKEQYCVCSERMLEDYKSEFVSKHYKLDSSLPFFPLPLERRINFIKQ